jgi:glycyl-tRNA synthetase alpha subunit
MRRGCILQQPYDIEVGAGTMHPETFLRVLGPIRTEWFTCSRAAGPPMGATAKIPTASTSTPNFK